MFRRLPLEVVTYILQLACQCSHDAALLRRVCWLWHGVMHSECARTERYRTCVVLPKQYYAWTSAECRASRGYLALLAADDTRRIPGKTRIRGTVFAAATLHRNWKAMQYIVDRCTIDSEIGLSTAALCGHIDVIQWALKRGAEWGDYTLVHACRGNSLPLVDFILHGEEMERGKLSQDLAFCEAAQRGDYDMLNMLWDHNQALGLGAIHSNALSAAVRGGNLKCVQLCFTSRLSLSGDVTWAWTKNASFYAREMERTEILEWARGYGINV